MDRQANGSRTLAASALNADKLFRVERSGDVLVIRELR